MRLITAGRIREFGERYPDAAAALLSFKTIARKAKWRNIQELRRTYPHADAVKMSSGKTATVLNIRRNRYRLILAIHYNTSKVFIMRFLPHAQYSSGTWKDEL
jgi:mRNA interferase HigB